ncbi:hypothetical protein V2K56_19370 [Pseudomonas alliivorans]|nr:hypothetical protein [Pseudomonas alliivorans]
MSDLAVDLVKSVSQFTDSVRLSRMSQLKRLTLKAFDQFIHQQTVPVELIDVNKRMGGANVEE